MVNDIPTARNLALEPEAPGAMAQVGRLIADLLGRGIDVRVQVSGTSMAPFLRCGDIVILRKVRAEGVSVGDVVLCAAADGRPILHRVLRTWRGPGGERVFQTRGDGNLKLDVPVPETRVLGKVSRVERPASRRSQSRLLDLESRPARLRGRLAAWLGLVASGIHYKLGTVPNR